MTDLVNRLNELCERHQGVTPGPWHTEAVFGDGVTEICATATAETGNPNVLATTFGGEDEPLTLQESVANAVAIADIPTLLAALREAAAEIERLRADADLALDLLETAFTAIENGDPCYENPDEHEGYIGNAVHLDNDTFQACADLLNRTRPMPDAARAIAKEST